MRPVDRPPPRLLAATSRVAPVMVLTAGLSGGIAVVTARQLGAEGRGALALMMAVVSITSILTSFGLNSAGRFHLVDPDTRVSLRSFTGLAAVLVAGEAIVAALGVWFGLPVTGLDVNVVDVGAGAAFGAAFLAAWLSRESLYAFGYTVRAALGSAGGSAVVLAIVGGLASADVQNYRPYIAALVIGSLAEIGFHAAKLRSENHVFRPQWNCREWRFLLRRGVPSLGLTAGQSMTFRVDRYIIGAVLGPGAVGIYSVAATLSEILRLIPSALGQVAFFRTASRSLQPKVLERARLILLLAMVPALAFMAIFAPQIVRMLFGSEFTSAVIPLRILLLGEIAIMSFQIDSRILTGLGALSSAGVAGMFGFAVVICADLILIPQYGMVGAAWASVGAYLGMGLLTRYLLHRRRHWAESATRQS